MRRVLGTELDAAFFDMGQAALKSFCRHNPGWEIWICDLGLTPEQRAELEQVAKILDYEIFEECTRWPHQIARLQLISELCKLDDAMILRLDMDTLTFGSVEPTVKMLAEVKPLIMMRVMTSPAFVGDMGAWMMSFDQVKPYYKRPEDWHSRYCFNAGVALMKSDPRLVDVADAALEKVRRHPGIFRIAEQTAFVAELYDQRVQIINLPTACNYYVTEERGRGITFFTPPIAPDGSEIVIAHIPLDKRYLFQMSGPFQTIGWWWRQWIERYREQPWTTE
jgi:hypothetical protein